MHVRFARFKGKNMPTEQRVRRSHTAVRADGSNETSDTSVLYFRREFQYDWPSETVNFFSIPGDWRKSGSEPCALSLANHPF